MAFATESDFASRGLGVAIGSMNAMRDAPDTPVQSIKTELASISTDVSQMTYRVREIASAIVGGGQPDALTGGPTPISLSVADHLLDIRRKLNELEKQISRFDSN